jgi:hypothetical protein
VVADAPRGGDAGARLGPRLGDAIRVGVSGFIEEIVTFLLANGIWAVLVGGIVYGMLRWPIALLLAPAIVPLTCGLARVADDIARERVVSLRTFGSGVFDRFWTKLALGLVQMIVLVVAIADIVLAPAIGGVAAVASMVLAVYVAASSLAYGLVFWVLLVDPELRHASVRQIGRLALAVVLRKPGQVAFLFLFAVLAASVTGYLVVPVLFLPSIVLLTVAAYVLPAAEEVRGVR